MKISYKSHQKNFLSAEEFHWLRNVHRKMRSMGENLAISTTAGVMEIKSMYVD